MIGWVSSANASRHQVKTFLGNQHFRLPHHLPQTCLELQQCKQPLLHPFQVYSLHPHFNNQLCLPKVLQQRAWKLLDQGVQMTMVEACFHLLRLPLLLILHQIMGVVSPKVLWCCKCNLLVTNLLAALSLQAMFNLTVTINPLATVCQPTPNKHNWKVCRCNLASIVACCSLSNNQRKLLPHSSQPYGLILSAQAWWTSI